LTVCIAVLVVLVGNRVEDNKVVVVAIAVDSMVVEVDSMVVEVNTAAVAIVVAVVQMVVVEIASYFPNN
jgi:hypothetical protein